MLYRSLGRTGEKISVLGFGCMRLPVLDGRRDRINIPLATAMLHYAIDHGVNYIDTAFPYHGTALETPGASEGFVGSALANGYREKVLVATKLPWWLVKSRGDFAKFLDGQLERLRTDCIDCYLLHAMNHETWPKLVDLGVREFLDAARADGRIRYTGFSYHDDSAFFAPIVDGYDWDLCQIQYNYMDVDYQAGAAGLAYAAGKGLGVVVMEPLRGGRLAGRIPESVQAIWASAPVERTPAEWALRFVWDDPRVSLLLSGMTAMEHVVANVEVADRGEAGSLTSEEHALIEQVREAYKARTAVGCTECRYCMPCPEGIEIPMILAAVNNAALYGDLDAERAGYEEMVQDGRSAAASACAECGQCEEACPQQIEIIEELKKASRIMGQ